MRKNSQFRNIPPSQVCAHRRQFPTQKQVRGSDGAYPSGVFTKQKQFSIVPQSGGEHCVCVSVCECESLQHSTVSRRDPPPRGVSVTSRPPSPCKSKQIMMDVQERHLARIRKAVCRLLSHTLRHGVTSFPVDAEVKDSRGGSLYANRGDAAIKPQRQSG